MILSIQSSAAAQISNGWPKFWPPVQLPPPPPLSAASTSLWAAKLSGNETAGTTTATRGSNASLYSTQLSQGGQTRVDDAQGGFRMHYLDQRIALVRYDASQATDNAVAPAQDSTPASVAPVSVPATTSGTSSGNVAA
jgi:hypothetical protein